MQDEDDAFHDAEHGHRTVTQSSEDSHDATESLRETHRSTSPMMMKALRDGDLERG